MTDLLERIVAFLTDSLPTSRQLLIGGPLGLLWAAAWLRCAGWLKTERGWRTGYTRKIFHFAIFAAAAASQALWGARGVCLLGGMTSLVLLAALLRGDGAPIYEALAREKDAPHRTWFIAIPYLATLLGGLAGNVLFGSAAVVGYLVTGLGDAVGEPVGTRWGRHPYRVPSLGDVPATRTLEGSAAVCAMSLVGLAIGVAVTPALSFGPDGWWLLPALALLSAGAEAISPHGWDNLTMQIVPTACASWWLGVGNA